MTFKLNDAVNVSALAFMSHGLPAVPRVGRIAGALIGSDNYLVDFGDDFAGHKGHYGAMDFEFGGRLPGNTGWYVRADYMGLVNVTEAKRTISGTKPTTVITDGVTGHEDVILSHLMKGNSISQLEAMGVFRIYRLAARIFDLKAKGHKIVTTMKKDATGKSYAEYTLRTTKSRAA